MPGANDRRAQWTLVAGAAIVIAGFAIGTPREGVIMITTYLGLAIWCYGCFRWAQVARPRALFAWGILLCAALPVALPLARTIHDWTVFVVIAAAVVSAAGVLFLLTGGVRAARDLEGW